MEWILPLREKKYSGPDHVSFLTLQKTEQGSIYISDNHKMALWCWGEILKQNLNTTFSILHIDAHFDCDSRGEVQFPKNWKELTFEGLYGLKMSDNLPMVRWDNYFPLFVKYESGLINQMISVTHDIGKKIKFDKEISAWDIPKYLDNILLSEKKWILNIDLDYFFARRFKEAPMFSDQYIEYIFSLLKLSYDEDRVLCITVALSPECCGSWENSERILKLFCRIFNLINPLVKNI